MPSHGAMKEVAATAEPRQRKMPKELDHAEMKTAENGGVVIEHRFTHYEHKPETHAFGAGDGHALARHIEKHFGISMPGRAKGTVASPGSGEAKEDEE